MSMITGGEGYIASNLKKLLHKPIIYDLQNGDDILDVEILSRKMKGIGTCFHLAAVSSIPYCEAHPFEALEANIVGTLNVLKTAKKEGAKVIFASSFAVYTNPHTIYGMTKIMGEKIVEHYDAIICRFSNVYGGIGFLKKETAVARLMKGTFEDRGHGAEERDFIHVDEVCRKLMAASMLPNGTIIDVCTGHKISIDDLVELSKSPSFPDNIKREDTEEVMK